MNTTRSVRLKELRKSKAATQSEVAQAIGVGRTNYVKMENGIQDIDTQSLINLSNFFDCSIDYILGIESTSTQQGLNPPLTCLQYAHTNEEEELIRKFNMLDERDQEDVMDIINRKLERMERRFSEEGKRA